MSKPTNRPRGDLTDHLITLRMDDQPSAHRRGLEPRTTVRARCRRLPLGLSVTLAVVALLHPWGARATTHPMDFEVLQKLYQQTQGDRWREGFTWTRGYEQGMDPCDDSEFFKGLSCSGSYGDQDRRATKILLSSLGLNGTLPEDIGSLTHLEEILLTMNNVSGQLPLSMCSLKHLNTVDLAFNKISGTIPNCIENVTRLYKFDLRTNELTGTIPKEFGKLQELQQLYLSGNKLTGTIPTELYNARMLSVLMLSYNELTGTIPKLFARFRMKETSAQPGLSWLDMRSNQLEGTYPSVIGDFGGV